MLKLRSEHRGFAGINKVERADVVDGTRIPDAAKKLVPAVEHRILFADEWRKVIFSVLVMGFYYCYAAFQSFGLRIVLAEFISTVAPARGKFVIFFPSSE